MSLSMFLGRVALPGCGLAIAGLLGWQVVKTGRVDLSSLSFMRADAKEEPTTPRPSPSTDDTPKIIAEGRVVAYPGAQIVVGSPIAGTIRRVQVQEKTIVHRGDLLVEFVSIDVLAQVAEAAARLDEAQVEVNRAELEEQRLESLVTKSNVSKQEYERVHFNVLGLRARRDAIQATHDRLTALLAKYRILSPIDGVVTARYTQPGETVAVAAPLITIIDLTRLRIEAEVDEYDIAHAALGSRAKISSEAYPNQVWEGHVEELADVLVGRRIRPEDPGKPTDTRVLPVRIAFQGPNPLRFGQRVEVEIAGHREKASPGVVKSCP